LSDHTGAGEDDEANDQQDLIDLDPNLEFKNQKNSEKSKSLRPVSSKGLRII
jgi:hypothetical protein